MMTLLILLILVLMAVFGGIYGADTRDGKDWQPRSSDRPRR